MSQGPYKRLAERLDALPNGYPPTADGVELRLLATIFTEEEAALAAQLRLTLETAAQIAERIGSDPKQTRNLLKGMVRRGLIRGARIAGGLGYGLMPFVVGIYEAQLPRIDGEMARLFEDYYRDAFGQMLAEQPKVHRVIPVGESIRVDMEVFPYESAAGIVASAKAWGVTECICRKQKELIDDPCDHPRDVCMLFNERPGVFDEHPTIRALTQEEASATLQRAANAGLVHSVSNNQEGMQYICNCCTCSCAILRGMADLGIANVIARSAFVNEVDADLCNGCENCVEYCQFDALTLDEEFVMRVNATRCVGCGVCVSFCSEEAMGLVRRPEGEVKPPPQTLKDWSMERATERGIDAQKVL